MRWFTFSCFVNLVFNLMICVPFLMGQDGLLTVDRIVSQPSITGTAPSAPAWSPDSKHLAFLWNDAAMPRREIWIVNSDGTQLRRLTDENEGPSGVQSFAWTPDGTRLLYLRAGDVWKISADDGSGAKRGGADGESPDRVGIERVRTEGGSGADSGIGANGEVPTNGGTVDDGGKSERLTNSGGDKSDLAVSPDGRFVSFLQSGDLWLLELGSNELEQVTKVGVPSIASVPLGRYNRPDVEIGPYVWGGPTYRWAPDSRTIAVHYVDRRKMRIVPFPYYLGKETTVNNLRRGYPGDPNEYRTVGFYELDSKKLNLLQLPEPTKRRVVDFTWSPKGMLLIDRESDTAVDRWLYKVNPKDRRLDEIWHDARQTRVYTSIGSAWHPDGEKVLFLSDLGERYGIYSLDSKSVSPQLLTNADFDVTAPPLAVDSGAIFFQSNQPSPFQRHVFCLSADGTATRISSRPGHHRPFPSPDGRKVALLHSDDVNPTELYLASATGQSPEQRITVSPPQEFRNRRWARPRYVSFPSRIDNYTLHARVLEPVNLDPNRKYPVVFGPAYSNTVRNRWNSRNALLDQLLVERGFIVVQVDVRGSTGYGREFREEFLMDFGGGDIEDLHSAVEFMAKLSYVEESRIGIWGSSYGGTLTIYSLFKKPGLFKAGVAAAAAVDPFFFGTDDVAIVRRPDTHPDAFTRGAIQFAGNLQDHLMIIHGTQDDIVPFKTTVKLADELMRLGKDFDFVFAPGATHRWTARPHHARYLLQKLTSHFERYLQPASRGR